MHLCHKFLPIVLGLGFLLKVTFTSQPATAYDKSSGALVPEIHLISNIAAEKIINEEVADVGDVVIDFSEIELNEMLASIERMRSYVIETQDLRSRNPGLVDRLRKINNLAEKLDYLLTRARKIFEDFDSSRKIKLRDLDELGYLVVRIITSQLFFPNRDAEFQSRATLEEPVIDERFLISVDRLAIGHFHLSKLTWGLQLEGYAPVLTVLPYAGTLSPRDLFLMTSALFGIGGVIKSNRLSYDGIKNLREANKAPADFYLNVAGTSAGFLDHDRTHYLDFSRAVSIALGQLPSNLKADLNDLKELFDMHRVKPSVKTILNAINPASNIKKAEFSVAYQEYMVRILEKVEDQIRKRMTREGKPIPIVFQDSTYNISETDLRTLADQILLYLIHEIDFPPLLFFSPRDLASLLAEPKNFPALFASSLAACRGRSLYKLDPSVIPESEKFIRANILSRYYEEADFLEGVPKLMVAYREGSGGETLPYSAAIYLRVNAAMALVSDALSEMPPLKELNYAFSAIRDASITPSLRANPMGSRDASVWIRPTPCSDVISTSVAP